MASTTRPRATRSASVVGPGVEHAVDFRWSRPTPMATCPAPSESPSPPIGAKTDGHFWLCDRFLIYQVGQEAIRLIDVRSTAEADGAEDKNASLPVRPSSTTASWRYVQSIGGPAAARLVRAGVHPVKKPTGGRIFARRSSNSRPARPACRRGWPRSWASWPPPRPLRGGHRDREQRSPPTSSPASAKP